MNNRYTTVMRPEAALQRANDFISVGKQSDALTALYDVIKERRARQWSETYEQIMLKFVELCVNLRNTMHAKDGMFQYRVFTQQVSVTSLRTVVERFLSLAEEKTSEAQKQSIERVEEIDDLDAGDAPEKMLQTVSGAVHQDRMDRTVLSPWLRFLWDSYRNCLDMLRNNVLVEEIYHWVARQSFSFCQRYQRRNEFRKLCELLRLHLSQIQKSQQNTEYRHTDFRVKLNSVESLQMMQDTRLCQLNTAIQMELWQEAYKSSEDLHNIMQLSKDKDRRMVKPASYVNYYDKLALIFWKGKNQLFHAAALLQKYVIYKDMKKSFTDEEAIEQATRVLLATLSIPPGGDSSSILTKLLDIEDQHMSNIRVLSSLLRLPVAPTRAGLLKELALLNIPEMAVAPARNLYKLLEHEFSPLQLATRVQNEIAQLNALERDDYSQYIETMKGVVATKVIGQLTVIYDALSLDRFEKIIPFYSRAELEQFLVQTSKHRSVKAHISHIDNCVRFNALDLTLAGGIEAGLEIDAASNGIEYVREHLSLLHNQLRDAVYHLDGPKFRDHSETILHHQIKSYLEHREHDYERMLQRRKQIENYKETNETQRKEKMMAAHAELIKREEQHRAEELRRMEEQNRENEQKRVQAERDEIQRRTKAEQLKRFQANPYYQQIVKERGEEVLMNMDPEMVIKEQRERMDIERRENQNKLRQQEKKFDYMVRAFYLEELEEIKKKSEEYLATAPERYDQCENRRVEKEIADHERSLITFNRMSEVRAEAEEFMRQRFAEHTDDFARLKADWRRKKEVEKKRRLEDRKLKRKEARREEAERHRIEQEEEAKQIAEQQERDRMEQQRQDSREMHQRLKERERFRAQERGMAERDDVRSTVRNMTSESGVTAPSSQWRTTNAAPVPYVSQQRSQMERDDVRSAVRNMTRDAGATAPPNVWRTAQAAAPPPQAQPTAHQPSHAQPTPPAPTNFPSQNWRDTMGNAPQPQSVRSTAPPSRQAPLPQRPPLNGNEQPTVQQAAGPKKYVPPQLRNQQQRQQ